MTLPTPTETELAFSIHGDLTTLNPLLDSTETTTRPIIGTYFDTPTGILSHAGWSLRVRTIDGHWQQTVKGPRLIATGPEWETDLDAANHHHLNFEALKQTPIWALIDGREDELKPIFETDVRRTTRLIHYPNATIELALDVGQLRSFLDDRVAPIRDLEIELKTGDIAPLFQYAIELSLNHEIMLQPASKAARGYRLIGTELPVARKYDTIKLDQDAATGGCFRVILINALSHLLQNLAAAYEGQMDGIHQVRVGLRRLRTAFRLFRSVLPKEPIKTFQSELKHFSRVFGDARNWDVFIGKTLAAATVDIPNTGWLTLAEHAAITKRAKAHQRVREVVESSAFNSLIISIMGWTQAQSATTVWTGASALQQSIAKTMPRMLQKYAQRSTERLNQLDGSDEALHSLRKHIKEFRYAIEFAGALYPEKAVESFLNPCRDIQEALGKVNDLSTADQLLSVLMTETPAIAPAAAELLPWTQTNKRKANRPVPKLLPQLIAKRPFWH